MVLNLKYAKSNARQIFIALLAMGKKEARYEHYPHLSKRIHPAGESTGRFLEFYLFFKPDSETNAFYINSARAKWSLCYHRFHLGTICTFRTTITAVAGEMDSALALGREALGLLPLKHKDIRAHAINSLGATHYHLGDMVEAARACTETGNLARQVGNLYLVMVSASYQARALMCQGQLAQPSWPDP